MRKISYELKAKLLEDYNTFNKYLECKRIQYKFFNGKCLHSEFEYACDFLDSMPLEICKEYDKLQHARQQRARKVKKRLIYMLSCGNCIFLSMTFSNKYISSTTDKKRKRDIEDYLRSQCKLYIANQDYGKCKGREHYHAIVLADSVDYKLYRKNFNSSINGIKIRYNELLDEHGKDIDIERISKYLSKLTNHAIKRTNKRSVIIYSKGFPKGL